MRITKLLIANRAEIARRIMRTCRSMGIATVAVYSDADANAAHVREADEAVPLRGLIPTDTYLRGDLLVDAARRTGADAVHPGYGFLSERAEFATQCVDAGLVWVGPPPAAIASMGSKVVARELVVTHGVDVLPGIDISTTADDKLPAAAEEIGWPVLVKASLGGGGRGMRVVRHASEIVEAVAAARREAAGAFGDDSVFLERYLDEPRHIEVQVLADRHGTVVHLFERECSIQRRHQKVIEEAPSPFIDAARRAEMGAAAVRAARAIDYVGAGTVEFLVAPSGEFYFLEMNTRLQVEHPVTELITGLDLVRLQLIVAQGEPLPRAVRHASIEGHAIEARLYAEDPDDDYRPAPGRLDRLRIADGHGVRVDRGYDDGELVSPYYDPLVAKVVAHAPTRAEATQRLVHALRRAHVHGLATNRDLLVGVLGHPEFHAGDIDTGFLDRHSPAELAGWQHPDAAALSALAGALARRAHAQVNVPHLASVPAGFRNNPAQLHERRFATRHGDTTVRYRLGRAPVFDVDGARFEDLEVVAARPDAVVLLKGGVRVQFDIHDAGDGAIHVDSAWGSASLRELPRFPDAQHARAAGSLTAPMPGKVVRVAVAAGEAVSAGQLLVVVEAMKMEHQIVAPHAGTVVDVGVAVGDSVDSGMVLVRLDEDGAREAGR